MTTKKKSRPLFEVPVEVESGAHSGWVYRSGAEEERGARVKTSSRGAGATVAAQSVDTLVLALAAMSQVVALGITIATIPLTIGLRALQSFTKR